MTKKHNPEGNNQSNRNPGRPQQYWFAYDPRLSLHVVFLTKPCTHARCQMCSLPLLSDANVQFADLIEQIDYFCETILMSAGASPVRGLIVGNNGSVFDPSTFSRSALFYLIARVRQLCPGIRKLGFITEPKFATNYFLESLRSECAYWEDEGEKEIELVVGLEAVSEKARKWIRKRYRIATIEDLVKRISKLSNKKPARKGANPVTFGLRAYCLLKPYPLNNDEALEDINACAEFLLDLHRRFKVPVTLHMNPVYVARGSNLEILYAIKSKESYEPPDERLIARALLGLKNYTAKGLGVSLGLYDEGLAVDNGSFIPARKGPLWQSLTNYNERSFRDREGALKDIEDKLNKPEE